MKNKTVVIVWVVVDLLLLIGCLFVVVEWFTITKNLKDPCGNCIRNNPEVASCIRTPTPRFKINVSTFYEG